MSSNKVVLYADAEFSSPYAMSAYVALTEKNVDFQLLPIDLGRGDQRQPEYLALSLTGKVPALIHQDFALSESSAMVEYIEEVFPGVALYPHEVRERARARQIQAWLRTDLGAIREERSSSNLFHRPAAALPALSDAARHAAEKLIAFTERLLPQGANELFGAWCIADFELSLMLNRLVSVGDAVPTRLVNYVRHQWSRPSVQRWASLDRSDSALV